MKLHELRKVDVDYEYINGVHDLYCQWLDKKSPQVYNELARKSIPLVNVFLSVAIRRHNLSGGEAVFDELYSFAYSTYLETVRKEKEFTEPNAFYAYMKTRVSYGTFSYYMKEHVQSDELVSEEDVEISQIPLGKGLDVGSISDRIFSSYMKYFFANYDEQEKEIFKYIMQYYREQKVEVTPSLLEVKFNLPENRAKELVDRGRILYKTILFFCLKEGEEPYQYLKKRQEKIMISKYFLTLLTLENKYPHLTELYALLGKQTHDVVQVFGGEKVKIPTPDELRELNKEVSAVMDFLENPTREHLDEISSKNNIDRRKLNYILKSYKTRFKNVPFLGEQLEAVDEVYG